MDFQALIVDKKPGVTQITLNRPQALNALNGQLLSELLTAFKMVQQDETTKVVILKGAGRAFCAGIDIKFVSECLDAGKEEALTFVNQGREIINLMESIPQPIIAAVSGFAVTGGFVLVYFSDIVIASEDAVFQDTHARWGFVPLWYESYRLSKILGVFRAKQVLFTSDRISASEAERLGLVYKVVPRGKLDEAAEELAGRLLEQSPTALGIIKAQVNQGTKVDWATAVTLVDEWVRKGLIAGFITGEAQERLRTFREKK